VGHGTATVGGFEEGEEAVVAELAAELELQAVDFGLQEGVAGVVVVVVVVVVVGGLLGGGLGVEFELAAGAQLVVALCG
jgi:hypothetical protein